MKKYKLKILSSIVAIALVATVFYNIPRTEYLMSDRITLASDVDKLNDVSDLVVLATVVNDKENVIVKSDIDGHEMFGYTVTTLNIKTIISGELNDESVKITEEYYESSDLTGKIIWTEGTYKPAKKGRDYIFYLKKYPDDSSYSGMYFPVDLEHGKYAIIKNVKDKTIDGLSASELDISKKSDLKEYKKWYKYVMKENEKYLED
jgi:hypothetical protein